jgi:hypothetical protein
MVVLAAAVAEEAVLSVDQEPQDKVTLVVLVVVVAVPQVEVVEVVVARLPEVIPHLQVVLVEMEQHQPLQDQASIMLEVEAVAVKEWLFLPVLADLAVEDLRVVVVTEQQILAEVEAGKLLVLILLTI